MKFEGLQNFDWYNEPENVIFGENELKIITKPHTDFWQSRHHGFGKDDGHFFYICKDGDFTCAVKWQFAEMENYRQCGLMLRMNEQNWFKVSIMSQIPQAKEIGHCLTIDGRSDWGCFQLERTVDSLWFKIIRNGDDYAVFYSHNGTDFICLRRFSLLNDQASVKVGAYACSPQDASFAATLKEIDIAP